MSDDSLITNGSAYNEIYVTYHNAVSIRTDKSWKILADREKELLKISQNNDIKETFGNYLLWLVVKYPGWYEANCQVLFQYIDKKLTKIEINNQNVSEQIPFLRKEFKGHRNGRFLNLISDELFTSLVEVEFAEAVGKIDYFNGIRGYIDNVLWKEWLDKYLSFEHKSPEKKTVLEWQQDLCVGTTVRFTPNLPSYLPKLPPFEFWKKICQ